MESCLLVSSYLVLLPLQYEDALESPLEQCISDSLVRNKDSGITSVGDLFSLVPSGVPKPSQAVVEEPEPKPISSPDSFSDFFTILSGKCCCNTCAYIIARLIKMELVSGISVGDHELWEVFGWGVSGFNGPVYLTNHCCFYLAVARSRPKSPRNRLPNPRDRSTYNLWRLVRYIFISESVSLEKGKEGGT